MMNLKYILLLAAIFGPSAARAVEFFDGVTPVTQGVIDITNDKLLFSDVSEAAGSRAKNITPVMLRTELGLVPGTNIQIQNSKLSAISALANSAGVLTNGGSGAFTYTPVADLAVPADLTAATAPTTVTVVSSTGTDAVIPVPDGTNAGVMLASEKTKLAGIAAGATANSSDATLLARANHTGNQPASTITGLPVEFCIAASDETTALSAGTGKVTFRAPFAFTLTALRASVNVAPTGTTILVDVNESGTTVISTKLMIDATEKTSTTAATPYVISDSAIADDAEISIDVDQVGSTVTGAGLKIWIIGTR